jgi:hypothetical protein
VARDAHDRLEAVTGLYLYHFWKELVAASVWSQISAEFDNPRIVIGARSAGGSNRVGQEREGLAVTMANPIREAAAPPSIVMNVRRLLDHLVGAGEHARWQVEADRLRGLEVDHQLVFHRRLHRQVGRLLALEDAVDIMGRRPLDYIAA